MKMFKPAVAFGAAMAAVLACTGAHAVPPPDVYAKLVAIGRVVDAPGTTFIYGPILANQSYSGAYFTRNIHYGPDPREILDVATPTAKSARLKPVMIYVSGGGGNKQVDYPNGRPFYDNIMLATVREGMVGVSTERRASREWDAGAKDVSNTIQWVRKNIARYGGDPNRIIIWGQSAGAGALSNYLTHKDTWGPDGLGVKAAVLMSGGYNLAPLQGKAVNSARQGPGDGGAAAIAAARAAGGAPAGPPPVDPAVQLAHSQLPGFKALKIPLYVTTAELDPERTVEAGEMLRDLMCKQGRCPRFQVNKMESHISEVSAINSDDKEVETPLFAWMKKVR